MRGQYNHRVRQDVDQRPTPPRSSGFGASPVAPTIEQLRARLTENRWVEPTVMHCEWCESKATSYYGQRAACDQHENLLQQVANDELRDIKPPSITGGDWSEY